MGALLCVHADVEHDTSKSIRRSPFIKHRRYISGEYELLDKTDIAPLRTTKDLQATTGGRMLCNFYSLFVESEHNTCFLDDRGQIISGEEYWRHHDLIEDYCGNAGECEPDEGAWDQDVTDGEETPSLYPSCNLFSSTSTSSTLISEHDYWSRDIMDPTPEHDTLERSHSFDKCLYQRADKKSLLSPFSASKTVGSARSATVSLTRSSSHLPRLHRVSFSPHPSHSRRSKYESMRPAVDLT